MTILSHLLEKHPNAADAVIVKSEIFQRYLQSYPFEDHPNGLLQPECWAAALGHDNKKHLKRIYCICDETKKFSTFEKFVKDIDPAADVTLIMLQDKEKDILGYTQESGQADYIDEKTAQKLFHLRDLANHRQRTIHKKDFQPT